MKPRHLALSVVSILVAAGLALGASFILPTTRPSPVIEHAPADAPPIVLPDPAGKAPLNVTRIGHAAVLLDFNGRHVLTDPWFTEKNHYHPGEALGLSIKDLPRLDLIVASHAHYDHFDIDAMAAYPHKDVPFLVGPDMATRARAAGFTQVHELRPWETWEQGAFKVTGVPAKHKVPEITFMIQSGGRSVYFGGDTLFIPELRRLPGMFPTIDLALLSVNGLHVLGEPVVMNAEQAAELAGVLKARVAVPIHYRFVGSWFTDTFILKRDGTPERFVAAARMLAPSTQVRVLEPGQRQSIR